MKKTLLLLAALFASTAQAGIVDGQPVDAAVTNAAFINKNTNDTTPSTLGLANTLTASGGSVTNLQAQVNAIDSFSGVVPNSAYNVKPVWSNNNVGTSTDSLKARVDTLSGLFFSGPVLPISNGGTGQTTASAAFNALSPMSALGDLIIGGSSPAGAGTRLSGNTTTTKMYLSQTGTGSVSAAPVWAQVAFADLSGFATIAQGGTNSTTALSNNRVMVSVSGQIVEQSALTASAPMRTNGSGLPTTGQTSLTTEVSGILPIANGGTNASSASGAFNNLSPVTLLGDLIYGSGALTNARLAGNTSSTKQFLTQTGTGSVSAAPVWGGIVSADLPTITLTGDATGAASGGTIGLTLASTAVTPGSYTNANITVDGKGRLTAATNGSGGGVTSVSNVDGTVTVTPTTGAVVVSLPTTAVSAGSYTTANITVDANGRLTSAANGSGGGSSGIELLSDPSFESGTVTTGWSKTGGTAAIVSPGSTGFLYGKFSASWTASASSQIFESTAWNVYGLAGSNCQAQVYYTYGGTSGDYTFQVVDNSAKVLGSVSLVAQSTAVSPTILNFPCGTSPSTSTLQWQLVSNVASPSVIYFDGTHLGSQQSLSQVSQAQVYGSIVTPGTSSCLWAVTSTTFANFSAQSACPTGTASGNATAPATKIPAITFSSMPAGDYFFVANGLISATSGQSTNVRFSDGTNSTQGIQSYNGSVAQVSTWTGHLAYSTPQSNVTVQVQGASGSGAVTITNNGTSPQTGFEILVYYFPSQAQAAYQASAGGLNPGEESITAATSCPIGTIAENGASLSTTAYPALFAAIGYTYGGSGANFNVPDARGVFERAAGTNGTLTESNGGSFSATQGTGQNDTMQGHYHTATTAFENFSAVGGATGYYSGNAALGGLQFYQTTDVVRAPITDGTNGTPRTGAETRPASISHLHCVRTVPATPAPVLVNSVTSNTSGQERVERVRFGGATDHSICSSSPCTITAQSGGWLSSVARTGTGAYTLNIVAGEFSAEPTCSCIAKDVGVANTWCQPSDSTNTATSYSVAVYNSTPLPADGYVEMICVGPR